ncbi:hypothetical protein [Pseudomonas sp. KNUC1026]|uniref:hypothetical protein n=1 Tax=Pseudomonas sp. KNUC1026 TaxID=2893890 RepID=UPI001F42143E|nr:hypothetical protein [Pseudomonas sp. KNUC1026]UFH49807.1 hypothetical protein LN139_24320 [Pseudomonas sp. KNUC1026]
MILLDGCPGLRRGSSAFIGFGEGAVKRFCQKNGQKSHNGAVLLLTACFIRRKTICTESVFGFLHTGHPIVALAGGKAPKMLAKGLFQAEFEQISGEVVPTGPWLCICQNID